MPGRVKVTGYVPAGELHVRGDVFDAAGRASQAAWDEVAGFTVDDLEDVTIEEEQ